MRDIGKCIQIVLRMTPHQRTIIYNHLSRHLVGIDLMHMNLIFANAEKIWVVSGQV